MSRISASAAREILKITERPEVLSFAGGLPAPELFPVTEIAAAFAGVLAEEGQLALQYSMTEGYLPLREWICSHLAGRGLQAGADRILITSGAQQGLDLVARVLLNPGDAVVVENPCYLAALQTFGGAEAELLLVGSDEQGMRVDELEGLLARRRPKLIYVVSEFHNPTGITLSLPRRRALLAFAQRHRIPILEDDPYGELRFGGEELPTLASMDDQGVVIYLGTFSKTLAPGLRLGWVVAPPSLAPTLVVAKQAADLHTSTLTQRAVARLLRGFDYPAHLGSLRRVYGERCQAMLAALGTQLPSGCAWTRPEGGLFVWVRLPSGADGDALLHQALAKRVAFVPGSAFYASSPQRDFIRLNFSNRPPELIEEGMRRLGQVLAEGS